MNRVYGPSGQRWKLIHDNVILVRLYVLMFGAGPVTGNWPIDPSRPET